MSSSTDDQTLDELVSLAESLQNQIENGTVPSVQYPTNTKTNIKFDTESGVWVFGDRESTQSAKSVDGAQKILKLAYTVQFLSQQLEEDRSSTLRELYYISESWGDAQFGKQGESNRLIEQLEMMTGERRDDFHMRPEESGATLLGPLEIREQTRRGERVIHCQEDVGEGGYQIPNDPDTIEFLSHDIDFVLAVETGGMRDRLIENGFDERYNCLVVHLKGQPSRATRRIIKRVHDSLSVPVTVFTDSDPWSYRIFGSVAYGSIKSAHLSEYLATPEAQFIGIRPEDIVSYDLPSDELSDADINALESELTDPRFETDYWSEQIELQLELEQKAEQQSLASRGLDFVTETYLPSRLDDMDVL